MKNKTDFDALAPRLAEGQNLLRTYFYDCLPFLDSAGTPQDRNRFNGKHRFLTALSHCPRFQVRLGQVEYRGVSETGAPLFRQKRVDVHLAVDLAVLACKHLITDAAILAGDSDFIPAVEAAKAEGVVVHLFHGPSAHCDLVALCDERTLITAEFLERVARMTTPLRVGA